MTDYPSTFDLTIPATDEQLAYEKSTWRAMWDSPEKETQRINHKLTLSLRKNNKVYAIFDTEYGPRILDGNPKL